MIITFILSILKKLLDFVLSYWKQIAVVILVGILLYAVDQRGYSRAYNERTQYYEKINKENHATLVSKIDSIEKTANSLVTNSTKAQQSLNSDLNTILNTVKSKKFTVTTKDGECKPSKDFIDAYNNLTIRGNK